MYHFYSLRFLQLLSLIYFQGAVSALHFQKFQVNLAYLYYICLCIKILNKHQQLIRNNKKPSLTLYASVAEVSTSVCTGTASLVFGRIVVGRQFGTTFHLTAFFVLCINKISISFLFILITILIIITLFIYQALVAV